MWTWTWSNESLVVGLCVSYVICLSKHVKTIRVGPGNSIGLIEPIVNKYPIRHTTLNYGVSAIGIIFDMFMRLWGYHRYHHGLVIVSFFLWQGPSISVSNAEFQTNCWATWARHFDWQQHLLKADTILQNGSCCSQCLFHPWDSENYCEQLVWRMAWHGLATITNQSLSVCGHSSISYQSDDRSNEIQWCKM